MSRVLGSLIMVLLVWSSAMAEPSCLKAICQLTPCLPFLQDDDPANPSKRCCGGLQEVVSMAKTTEDRITICECLKEALSTIDYDPVVIPFLCEQCGLTITVPPIDENTDCSQAV